LGYIRDWLLGNARIVAIIDVPLETFLPNTGTKTTIMVLQKTKKIPENYSVFMSVAEYCGHDRRGKEIPEDDIVDMAIKFKQWSKDNKFSF